MSQQRTIFVYLYRLNDVPQYVGQAVCVERRDRRHKADKDLIPFDGFMRKTGCEKFSLEVVGSCSDHPRGVKINALENKMMDEYRTFQPESGCGWNFGRAEKFEYRTVAAYRRWLSASRAASKRTTTDPQWIFAMRLANDKLWNDPEFRSKQRIAVQKMHADPKHRATRRVSNQKLQADPEYRAKMQKVYASPKWKAANKAAHIKLWSDPAHRTKMQEMYTGSKWKTSIAEMTANPKWKVAQQNGRLQKSLNIPHIRARYELGLCSDRKGRCPRPHAPGSTKCRRCRLRDNPYELNRRKQICKQVSRGSTSGL